MNTLVFNFNDLDSNAAGESLSRYFSGAGEQVVQTMVVPGVKRTSGISFKQIDVTFADGQKLSLLVKQTGDIFKVQLNGKDLAIHAQDDQEAAMGEMVRAMDAGRTKFQMSLAKARAILPPTIRMAQPKILSALEQKLAALNDSIMLAHEELATFDSVDPTTLEEPVNV